MSQQTAYAWEAHYPEGIDWNEAFHGRPLYALLDDAVERWPDNTALEFLGRTYSYSKLKEMVDRSARGLQSMGVVKGTRVGLFMPNCPHYIVAYYAILKCGGTVVNFNPLVPSEALTTPGVGVPLFLVLFAVLLFGVVLGGVATWFAQGQHRRDERSWRRETERLNREVEVLRRSPSLPIVDDLAKS